MALRRLQWAGDPEPESHDDAIAYNPAMLPLDSFSALSIAACALLLATVASLWLAPRRSWIVLLAATLATSYIAGVLHGSAAIWVVLLAAALLIYRRFSLLWVRRLSVVAIVALALLLGMHALPGFSNPIVVHDVVLTPDAVPYTLYFNFDKTIAGILLLGIGGMSSVVPPLSEALKRALPIMAATVLVAMLLSLAMGYVRFEPRWHSLFWIWAVTNLFLTCLSEEAFFRAFIQRETRKALGSHRHAVPIAVGISAVLFGVAHFAGGWPYVVLATVAGLGYALVYERTRRIELAMLTHFALNATHFLLFTYPALA